MVVRLSDDGKNCSFVIYCDGLTFEGPSMFPFGPETSNAVPSCGGPDRRSRLLRPPLLVIAVSIDGGLIVHETLLLSSRFVILFLGMAVPEKAVRRVNSEGSL